MVKPTNALLSMDDFSRLFRRQFYLQKGKGHCRKDMYYPAKKINPGVKSKYWIMMVFISTAERYGFTQNEIIEELKVPPSEFNIIRKHLLNLLESCRDDELSRMVEVKSGLVHNTIFYNLNIKPHVNQNTQNGRGETYKSKSFKIS